MEQTHTMNYRESIEYLLANTSLSENKSKVYYYEENLGQKAYFDKIYRFYSSNLLYNRILVPDPSYIVFYNKNEIYAEAKKSNGHCIIAFDRGIISQLASWYGYYFNFTDIKGLEEFELLESTIRKNKISDLLEQAILHFTFYHELAHLIQYTSQEEFEREDFLSGNCEFDGEKHVEEYDADTFAGIALTTHIFQYIKNLGLTEMELQNHLNDFVSITLAGVMAYVLSLPMCQEEFYTEKAKHPHNSIRVNNLVSVVARHFEELINQSEINCHIDKKAIVERSNIILLNLLVYFNLQDPLLRYGRDMITNLDKIKSYHNKLIKLCADYEFAAVEKWNSLQ